LRQLLKCNLRLFASLRRLPLLSLSLRRTSKGLTVAKLAKKLTTLSACEPSVAHASFAFLAAGQSARLEQARSCGSSMTACAATLAWFSILWSLRVLAFRGETTLEEADALQAEDSQGEAIHLNDESTEAESAVDPGDGQANPAEQRILSSLGAGTPGSGVGTSCSGVFLSSKGNCSTVSIPGVDAVVHKVQLYCYSLDLKAKAGAKASSDAIGECRIPRRKSCLEDEQCRRGTYCLPCEQNNGYTCQEFTQSQIHDRLHTTPPATVAAMLLHFVGNYLSSLETAASSQKSLIRDARTGAVSPYGVNPQLAISALTSLGRSFANISEATAAGKSSASKSGAAFIFSGDGRFIMKSIRESEFKVFTGQLVERIAVHARLDSATCSPEDSSWCWASHALAHTTLVVPLLALSNAKQSEYWIAMPASAPLRSLATLHDDASSSVWGTVRYFDTKPLPAKSNARPEFLQKLPYLGFLPKQQETDAAQTSQWSNLEATLSKDVELLSVKTREDESLVDYSLLFELYQPSKKVLDPGPGCISSVDCFFPEGRGRCRVLCVSIIDYLVTYGPMRRLESFVKGGKFNGYGTKVVAMLRCLFEQALPLGSRVTPVDMDFNSRLFEIPKGNILSNQALCAEYTEYACNDLEISDCDIEDTHIKFVGHKFGYRTHFCGSFWASRAYHLHRLSRADWIASEIVIVPGVPNLRFEYC